MVKVGVDNHHNGADTVVDDKFLGVIDKFPGVVDKFLLQVDIVAGNYVVVVDIVVDNFD